MIELNCKTTTNYNKVWGWLKTQVIIGLSTNSSYMLSLFYSQKNGNILFTQRGFSHPYSYTTKEDFVKCCKSDALEFIVPNKTHTKEK